MSTPVKAFSILVVLLLAIYNNLPTLDRFLPGYAEQTAIKLQVKLEQLKVGIEQLQGLEMALADPKKSEIQILHTSGKIFPMDHISLEGLSEDFTFETKDFSTTLTVKPEKKNKIFVTKVAARLNSLFDHVFKIKSLEFSKKDGALVINVGKNKRLSDKIEPLKSLIAGELDLSYQEDESRYLARLKDPDNVVSLGLDLQGGMYQDVGVKVDVVLQSSMQATAESIEDILIEENMNYDLVAVGEGNTVEVVLQEGEVIDLTSDAFVGITNRGFETSTIENGVIFTLTAEEERRIKSKAVDQALETIRNRIDQLGVKEPSIQRRGENSIIIQLPGLTDPDRARRVIGQVAVLEFMIVALNGDPNRLKPSEILAFQDVRDPLTKEIQSSVPYVLEKKVLLKGDMIRDARVRFQQTGEASVEMSFDDKGTDLFAQITRENVRRRLAIVLDGKVQSAPSINEPIEGGVASITGNFSAEEASELSMVLRSGALPAPIVINEERTVGASLGEDSIRQALASLAIGFAAVVLFMMIYYKVAGIFSVLALIFNLLLIIAALAYFGATLTLPGMAGIILTIGMAVDANVLIFERIREEINLGKGIRIAVQTGFQKATITILDSNITTILAAIVLFQYGTGPIKGFAVTLSIGIAASMFTSIVVGKFLFEVVYLRKQRLDKISI